MSAATTTRFLSARNLLWIVIAAAFGLAILIVLAAFADNRMNLGAKHASALSQGFFLGSDQLGRSLWQQLCRAFLITVVLGGLASLVSTTIGFLLGLGSLSRNPVLRGILTVIIDLKSGLPTFFVALLLGAIAGQTPLFLFSVLCFVGVEFSARATRDNASLFADGTMFRALIKEGVPRNRRLAHILLFVSPLLLPLWALVFLEAILVESGLSFVGLGLRPELSSLGVLIREYYRIMLENPWPLALATSTLGAACIALFHLARSRNG